MELPTLYFAGALVGVVIAGAIAAGNGLAGRHDGLRALLGASLALSSGLGLLGLRDATEAWLSQGLGTSLLIASALFYRLAVDRLVQRDEWSRLTVAAGGVALLAVWGAIIGDAPASVRSVIAPLALAAVLWLPAWSLLAAETRQPGRSRFVIAAAFLLGALAALARALAVGMGAAPLSPTQPSPANLALAVAVVVMVTVASFSFLVVLREREHARLVMLDPLTELLNRGAFSERAEAALALARRRDLTCSLILVDLDYIDRVNDAHGYVAGDRVLQHVAGLLRKLLRREDVLGRYGSDEFAMLLFATPLAGSYAVAQRIELALAAHPPRYRQTGIPVTGSFGVAEWTHGSAAGLDDLMHRADRARQAAKARGRARIVREDEVAG